ncbi:uncharacterized protein F5147DRAFT_775338 [Suillus discolor]|uniref:Uncharacterized protein n=1 Tax=Suillus discolor TaxID=1912936 RepID=A0A9P7F4Z2_9AGAM|nr:uncharacterized protein F5147DRAFT_775338 [Suillus discolor]KAG2105019.1 hypothetical protein F5147DRAFT_775338 [Suillus discolor]
MSNDNEHKNVPGTFPLSSLAVVSGLSVDAGALDLGVESAWTRDAAIARVKKSLSLRVEAPTSDQLSTDSWLGALGAPSKTQGPPLTDGGEGSAMMSISPILGSVSGLQTSHFRICTDRNVDLDTNIQNVAHHSNENISWFDAPNDNDIGEVPEFPILKPIVQAITSTPRVTYELKGKATEASKDAPETDDLFENWTEIDEHVARLSKPDPRDTDESLKRLWNDNNCCESLQVQNLALQRYRNLARIEFAEQGNLIENLKEQVRELQNLVIQSQSRENEAWKQTQDTYRAPNLSEPKNMEPKREAPVVAQEQRDPLKESQRRETTEDTRYQRASSILPACYK